MMRKFIVIIALLSVFTGVLLLVRRSIPYSDRSDLFSADITMDSIWSLGPAVGFYDKKTQKYYWLKSIEPIDQNILDTLKSKKASIKYLKFLKGPLENRIVRMEVDSVPIFDQIIKRE